MRIVALACLVFVFSTSIAGAVQLPDQPMSPASEVVFFPFDDYSIPFTYGLRLNLHAGEKHGVVVPLGGPDAPDSDMVELYGSVIRVDGEFRMWYMGRNFKTDDFQHGPFRICYATSRDGVKWTKPDLNLVEFLGSRKNNLVMQTDKDGNQTAIRAQSILVLHEPDDPDIDRRFKMMIETEGPYPPNASGRAFFSPDGIRWTPSKRNPVITHNNEPSGLVRFNGCYYLNAHNINFWDIGRVLATYISYDFETWTEASNLGFRRSYDETLVHRGDGKQEVHMGAALWNRGNVLIGFYGMWQYPEKGGNLKLHMPLGFVVSHDAVHYSEPIPDFEIIPGKGELDGSWPALQQAQAFENIGDETYVWYSCWDEYGWANKDPSNNGGLVRLAKWPRDRLGHFHEFYCEKLTEETAPNRKPPHFVTRLVVPEKGDGLFVNADGLGPDSRLKVELLDERLQPIPGYSGESAALLTQSGLRQPIHWAGGKKMDAMSSPVRIQVEYAGDESEKIQVYALYVGR
jgi:hypothetical protein